MRKIKLTGGHPFPPLLDFDGSTYVSLVKQVDASMNKIITFNLYLESSTHDYGDSIIRFPNSQVDDFNIYFSSLGKIQLYTNNFNSAMGGFTKTISTDWLKRHLFFEVGKAQGTFKYLKINGVLQTNEGGTNGSGGSPAFGGQASIIMQNAALWDIRIFDYDTSAFSGTGRLMHWWKGYPKGNTDAAWADLVGDVSGYVQGGNPTPKAREIPGFYSEVDWPTGNKLKFNQVLGTSTTGVDFQLSVIRNKEMNNIIGDAGSTNLTISAINPTTGVLTIPNIPTYANFTKETSSWMIKDVNNNTTSIFCSINDVTKTVTLNPSSGTSIFTVGHNISLFNPFLNYEFSGDQRSAPSIPISATAWRNRSQGGGPIFKDGSTYKWLFWGQRTTPTVANQVGLAVSNDMIHWDVSNNDQPIVGLEQAKVSSIYPTGNIMMKDSSYCCMFSCTSTGSAGARGYIGIMYFDKDVSNLSFTGPLNPNNAFSLAYGSIEKIGSEYHMLYTDVSTVGYAIYAAKSNNLEGPYTKYQTVLVPSLAVAGTAWDYYVDMPFIFNDGKKIRGLFGSQCNTTTPGTGAGNRQASLLDFDANTQTWTPNILGPVIINPIDIPVDYAWAYDHVGASIATLVDGSSMFMCIAMNQGTNNYNVTMMKVKNYGAATSTNLSTSKKLMLGQYSPAIPNHVIFLGTSNSAAQNNYISYDNGVSFSMNSDLSTRMVGMTSIPYLYLSPNGQHVLAGGINGVNSPWAWSHDYGVTWNSSTAISPEEGYLRCSDDGQIMMKGSYQNTPGSGTNAVYSKNGGTTWNKFEPSIGADNRKYITPQISADGKYAMITSQYATANLYAVFSSNYGDNPTFLKDIDNPSYPISETYSGVWGNGMSTNGKYMINGGYGVLQNSSDYGYSWYTIYNDTKDVNHAAFPMMSRDGRYQVYQTYIDSSLYGSSNYGVTWNNFYKSSGGYFVPVANTTKSSHDGLNLIARSAASVYEVWRCKNFDINGWYKTTTFASAISQLELSSDGTLVIAELADGKIMYSWDGGETFTQSSFTNPLAPSNNMWLKIN